MHNFTKFCHFEVIYGIKTPLCRLSRFIIHSCFPFYFFDIWFLVFQFFNKKAFVGFLLFACLVPRPDCFELLFLFFFSFSSFGFDPLLFRF